MRIVAENLDTLERFTDEAKSLTSDDIRELNDFRIPVLGGTEREIN